MKRGESAYDGHALITPCHGEVGTYLDCVRGAHRNPGYSHARKDMTAYLKAAHRNRIFENSSGGSAHARKADDRGHEEETVGRDEAKLHKGEGDGVTKLEHDGLARVGG